MKICDITQFYSPVSGGVKRYVGEKRAYLRDHTQNEHILIIPGAENRVEREGRLRTYTIASPMISKATRYRALLALHLIEEILEQERPDLIESGDPYQVAWKIVACGQALKIPTVGFYHSHFSEAYVRSVSKYFGRVWMQIAEKASRRYVCSLYNRFERTLVPSPGLGQLLTQWGVKNTVDVDLGVNLEAFFPDDSARETLRQKLRIPREAQVLIYVGRLAPEKNVKTLLKAFELLASESPESFYFVVIGDGAYRAEVAKLVAMGRNAFGDRVIHVPYCSNVHELANWYRAADLMVHPSINETFGLVALESQACGTPVMGIHGSYMDRIIFTDQKDWARENTAPSLAAAIKRVSKNDLREMGLAASHLVKTRYGWTSVFEKLFAIYHEVIRGYIR